MKKLFLTIVSVLGMLAVSAQSACDASYFVDSVALNGGFQVYDNSAAYDGAIVSWDWSVTDNNGIVVAQDDAQNPTFFFNDLGEYTICLTILTEGMDSMMQDSIMSTCVSCQSYEYLGNTLVLVENNNQSSWNCVNGGCVEAQNDTGEYASYDQCYWSCAGIDSVMTWNCVEESCIEVMDDSGTFDSYGACLDYCEDDNPIEESSCEALFYAMTDSVDIMPITFVDGSQLGDGNIEAWDWTIVNGDGVAIAASGDQYPSVTFDSYGDYTVCLTITGTAVGDSLNELMTYTCFVCDTFLYDENGFIAYSALSQTAISEYELSLLDDNRVFDIQGREWKGSFADLPKGMYIINRKKLMKFE